MDSLSLRDFYVILAILALNLSSLSSAAGPPNPVVQGIQTQNGSQININQHGNPPGKPAPELDIQPATPTKNKTSAEGKPDSMSNDKKPSQKSPNQKLDVIDTVENPNESALQSGMVTRGILVFVGLTFLFLLYAGLKTYRKRNRKSKRRTVVRRYGGKKYDVEMEPLPLSDEEDETIFELNGPSTSK